MVKELFQKVRQKNEIDQEIKLLEEAKSTLSTKCGDNRRKIKDLEEKLSKYKPDLTKFNYNEPINVKSDYEILTEFNSYKPIETNRDKNIIRELESKKNIFARFDITSKLSTKLEKQIGELKEKKSQLVKECGVLNISIRNDSAKIRNLEEMLEAAKIRNYKENFKSNLLFSESGKLFIPFEKILGKIIEPANPQEEKIFITNEDFLRRIRASDGKQGNQLDSSHNNSSIEGNNNVKRKAAEKELNQENKAKAEPAPIRPAPSRPSSLSSVAHNNSAIEKGQEQSKVEPAVTKASRPPIPPKSEAAKRAALEFAAKNLEDMLLRRGNQLNSSSHNDSIGTDHNVDGTAAVEKLDKLENKSPVESALEGPPVPKKSALVKSAAAKLAAAKKTTAANPAVATNKPAGYQEQSENDLAKSSNSREESFQFKINEDLKDSRNEPVATSSSAARSSRAPLSKKSEALRLAAANLESMLLRGSNQLNSSSHNDSIGTDHNIDDGTAAVKELDQTSNSAAANPAIATNKPAGYQEQSENDSAKNSSSLKEDFQPKGILKKGPDQIGESRKRVHFQDGLPNNQIQKEEGNNLNSNIENYSAKSVKNLRAKFESTEPQTEEKRLRGKANQPNSLVHNSSSAKEKNNNFKEVVEAAVGSNRSKEDKGSRSC